MSAITGFFAPDTTYVSNNTSRERIVKAMAGALKRRTGMLQNTFRYCDIDTTMHQNYRGPQVHPPVRRICLQSAGITTGVAR